MLHPSFSLIILLNQVILRDLSKSMRFGQLSPPYSTGFCKISFRNFGGFTPHKKFCYILSTFVKVYIFGDGRDSRICTNLDLRRLFIIVILPIGVNNLGVQILIIRLISSILFSILISLISVILSMLKSIPKDVNSVVQIKSFPLKKLILLSPHTPILIILVFQS